MQASSSMNIAKTAKMHRKSFPFSPKLRQGNVVIFIVIVGFIEQRMKASLATLLYTMEVLWWRISGVVQEYTQEPTNCQVNIVNKN